MKDSSQQINKAFQLFENQKHDKAKVKFDKLCRQNKSDAELWHIAGINDGILGNFHAAEVKLKHAVSLQPENQNILLDLGFALEQMGQFSKAIPFYKKALSLTPQDSDISFRLGIALDSNGEFKEALAHYRKGLEFNPSNYSIYLNMGITLGNLEQYKEAIECYKKYSEHQDDASINNNIGSAYRSLKDFENAEKYFKKSLELSGGVGAALPNLISLYSNFSKYEKILELHQKGIQYTEDQHVAHSNVLFNLACRGNLSVDDMHQANIRWSEIHGKAGRLNKFNHSKNRRNTKIRIGYVSPDFRNHPVSYFFEPVLKNHDFEKYDIYCYSNTEQTDDTTDRLKSYATEWRDVFKLSDQELATLIFKDKIDILIDLAGHTAHNRLRAFTYKPAPVQATYLGYFGCTGIEEIDYWITDEIIHPIDTKETSVEEKYRLNRCFYAYQPPATEIEIAPASTSENFTFASFNHFRKVTDESLRLWAKVLLAVPESVLLFKAAVLNNEDARNSIIKIFENMGVSKDRLELVGFVDSQQDHFKLYNKVDICLDTFPFTGATTTVESLWMGIPTITLSGQTIAHRFSTSFLTCVGLENYCAKSEDEYVQIAVEQTKHRETLLDFRKNLRSRLLESDLCNGKGLASSIETFFEDAMLKYQS